MPTLSLTEEYSFVRRENQECLLVQVPERKGKNGTAPSPARKERVPLLKVDEVVVIGEVTLAASAIHALLEREIDIPFLGHHGQFKGRISPPLSKNAVLRMAQCRAHQEMRSRGELARQCVIGKRSNQRLRLQRMQRTRKEAEIQRSINQRADILATLEQLPVQQTAARHVLVSGEQGIEGTVLGTILGLEGAGSAASFRCFHSFLTNQHQWPFPGRVKRPATDPVNALLSFGYALLTSKVAHAVQVVGFDHSIRTNQSSLPNHGDRYRNGKPISSSLAESSVNQIISKRFVKKQHMRWGRRGPIYCCRSERGCSMIPSRRPFSPVSLGGGLVLQQSAGQGGNVLTTVLFHTLWIGLLW